MFKNLIKSASINLGVFTVSTQDIEVIKKFINSVKPVSTQFKLKRIGNKNGDGGYLLPDDFEGISFCFSPGVSNEASFEEELTSKGIKCFLADYSVAEAPLENEKIKFDKKFVGSYESEKFIDINSWINKYKLDLKGDGILQMDIEGQEYEAIYALNDNLLRKFRIVVIEFHALDYLFNKFGFNIINNTFQKLLKDYKVVHIHPNNCCGVVSKKNIEIPRIMEFTFLRKDRIDKVSQVKDFPHKLDVKNTDKDDIVLADCWYN